MLSCTAWHAGQVHEPRHAADAQQRRLLNAVRLTELCWLARGDQYCCCLAAECHASLLPQQSRYWTAAAAAGVATSLCVWCCAELHVVRCQDERASQLLRCST